MAFKVQDFVKETSSVTGTGDIALGGAVTNYVAFSSYMSNTDTTWYSISLGTQWETGLGTYNNGANSITRTTVYSSSTGSAVSFSSGIKTIICGLPSVIGKTLNPATTAQWLANTASLLLSTDQVWASGAETALVDGISLTATFSNASTSVTVTTSLAVDAPIHFTTTGALPTNFTASTEYYVLTNSGTVLTVAATRGGSAITAGSAGSGTQTLVGRVWINYALGINFSLNTIAGNRTLAKPHNAKAGQVGRIRIVQDGTGSRTLTIAASSNYKYAGGTAPTLSTAASSDDVLYFDAVSSTDVRMANALAWA